MPTGMQTTEQALVQDLGLSEGGLERRKRFVALASSDLKRIAALKDLVIRNHEQFAAQFFEFLSGIEDARPLFANRELYQRARQLKSEHLVAMVSGVYDGDYVNQRIELARLYGKVGLP